MSKRILLADDSLTIQKVVELTFMDEDFEVEAVGSGDEAISRLAGDLPNIVIADVHMPGASGYEVCRQAKAMSSNLPVLLLVGTFEALDENEMVECGADGNLKKPFDSQELLQVVRRMTSGDAPQRVEEAEEPDSAPIEGLEQTSHDDEAGVEEPVQSVTGFDLGRGEVEVTTELEEPAPALADFDGTASDLEDEPELAPVDLGIDAEVSPEPDEDLMEASDNETVLLDVLPPMPVSDHVAVQAEEQVEEPAEEQAEEQVQDDLEREVSALLESAPEVEEEVVGAEAVDHETAEQEQQEPAAVGAGGLSDDDVERVARRVVELMSDDAVREVAWDVIPDMVEIVIKARVRELEAEVD